MGSFWILSLMLVWKEESTDFLGEIPAGEVSVGIAGCLTPGAATGFLGDNEVFFLGELGFAIILVEVSIADAGLVVYLVGELFDCITPLGVIFWTVLSVDTLWLLEEETTFGLLPAILVPVCVGCFFTTGLVLGSDFLTGIVLDLRRGLVGEWLATVATFLDTAGAAGLETLPAACPADLRFDSGELAVSLDLGFNIGLL